MLVCSAVEYFYFVDVIRPADKVAHNIVVVRRLHYITNLKHELNGTKAYRETSSDEKIVVNSHSNELPYEIAVNVKKSHPTMCWLPKLHS